MGYVAQPPETVAGFVPEVCLRGEGRGAEALEAEGCVGRGCTREREIFRPVRG